MSKNIKQISWKNDEEIREYVHNLLKQEKHDPIEETEEYKKIVNDVNEKARKRVDEVILELIDDCDDESMKEFIRKSPTFHRFCYEKKKILKEEYGMEWKSIIEMNPNIRYD